MKYIIMCGGPKSAKPLREIYGEALVARTIRLLKENKISDIAISTTDDRYEKYGPVLKHDNPNKWKDYYWLKCFYPMTEPVCYLFGDVFYSPRAIKTIVEKQTDDIEFFGSAPPYSDLYQKKWAEPFAFKVANIERFNRCLENTIRIDKQGMFKRMPIAWELWQVIKNTPINRIDYTNYTVINDYTIDVDNDTQAQWIIDRGVGKETGPL